VNAPRVTQVGSNLHCIPASLSHWPTLIGLLWLRETRRKGCRAITRNVKEPTACHDASLIRCFPRAWFTLRWTLTVFVE